ncbi:long-chain fatty acid--CoA ligase [Gordonia sp. TBRC 11910]|uniref:Long-chain fatty acid--CoA ligase n=1 Tax=Gordonia asplenii TaxID=2725283 RepID=A0A848KZR6_9ACTN|nr:long-chain fatty acid--CoA ligase [Gordonia asplenii]NMO00938.1 long-chain fatty acid--CoA ligase [Gordonia asplenii]
MRNQGVGSWPRRTSRRSPEQTAIIFRGNEISYEQLDERSRRLAHALAERGVEQGDRIALLSANHPAYLEALFAAGLLGAVLVPLNARLTPPEVTYALADSGARVLIHSAALSDVAAQSSAQAGAEVLISLDGAGAESILDYETVIAQASADDVDVAVSHDDPCFIMYTSGTTGHPKGVVLTHGSVTFAALNPIVDLDLRSDEVSLVVAPLFHTAALNFISLPTLLKGGTVVIEDGFDAERVLAVIENYGVTYGFGVPTMLDAMSAHPSFDDADLSSIRRWIVAAAPVPPRTLTTYASRGVALCQAYGLTETGPGALILKPDEVERKLGSAGKSHFFTDVRVVDAAGVETEVGQRGEIQISGPNVMREYWNRPADTAASFTDDGWFRSGDVGVRDDEGFITVVDRLKDMIISGGENIYPAEIEAVVLSMPGVVECGVFGIPDEKWGEVGCAAVSLAPGATLTFADLVSYLSDRLARYKIPKSMVVLAEIPRNATGKIRKDRLRSIYA